MKAFNNDKELKKGLIEDLKRHQEADAFVRGAWLVDKEKVEGGDFKGCFYGCTMQTKEDPLEKFSEKYNIDPWYVHITERIFEGLPKDEFEGFPLKAIQIVPEGFDFNTIKSQFFYTLLMDKDKGQINYCGDDEDCIEAIKGVASLFKVDFNKIDKRAALSAAYSALSAADSAADSAAYSAADSARSAVESARSAAYSAAYSADSADSAVESAAYSADSAVESARSAAYSAAYSADSADSAVESARSAAYSAAESNHYIWMRDMLFDLIENF